VSDERTYAAIGAAMDVHRELKHGFVEPVYQEALALELQRRGVPFEREAELPIHYRGQRLNTGYRADFVCFGNLLVEIKAQRSVGPVEEAQVLNYLKVTDLETALLLNFGAPSLYHRRFVHTHQSRAAGPGR
jgi:GxxExxY protein